MINESFDFDSDLDFLNDVKLDKESKSISKESSAFGSAGSAASSFDLNLNLNCNNNNNNNQYNNQIDLISLTKKVENYNKIVLRLKKLKNEKDQLQKYLESLNQSAVVMKSLYQQENEITQKLQLENSKLLSNLEKTELELNNVSKELSRKKLGFEQSKASLENNIIEYKEKILPEQYKLYNDLGLKYVEMAKKLQEYNLLERMDQKKVQRVINHLKEHSIPIKSLKRSQLGTKGKSSNTLNLEIDNCSVKNSKKSEIILEPKKEMKTQCTQYISSSTTRSTCTSIFIKKHDIGTNFPEIVHKSVEDILREMIFDMAPLSPINDLMLMEYENDVSTQDNCINLNKANASIVFSVNNEHFDNINEFDTCNENVIELSASALETEHMNMQSISLAKQVKSKIVDLELTNKSLVVENSLLTDEKSKEEIVEEMKNNNIIFPNSLDSLAEPELNNAVDIQNSSSVILLIQNEAIDEFDKFNNVSELKSADIKTHKYLEHKNKKLLPVGVESASQISLKNELDDVTKKNNFVNYSENIKNKEPNEMEDIEFSEIVRENDTIDNVLEVETTENQVQQILDIEKCSSTIFGVDDKSIVPSINSPKKILEPVTANSVENKNSSFDDNKLVDCFELSPSDTEELERSLECINDLSVNKLFLNDSVLEVKESYENKELSNCKKIDKLSPIKNEDCISLEQNAAIGKNTSSQFNDLLFNKINMLRESEKGLSLEHERDVTTKKTVHRDYNRKFHTLEEIKNLLQESQVKENILNLLNGDVSNYSLTNLCSLIGETIFKLIDHNRSSESSNQMQLELLNERIHMLTKQIENEKITEPAKIDLKIDAEKKMNNIIDTYDARNSDVISPISELSSIEFLNTETQNSVESFPENENGNCSSIFLEKVPKKTFQCDPNKRTLRSGNSYNSFGKIPETKNIKNQKKNICNSKPISSNLKNKLDSLFMIETNFAVIESCDDKISAVDELLKKFPTQRKRSRKSFSEKHKMSDKLEPESDEKKFDCKKLKLEEISKSELQQQRTPERCDSSNAFCEKEEDRRDSDNYGISLLEENEKDFNNFVDRILDEFNPRMKMSPIQEIPKICNAESNSLDDNFLINDNYNLEIPISHQSYEDVFENLEFDFQSPESPPQFFQETNSFDIIEIPLNPYNDDSPASPPMHFNVEYEEPILIPGKRKVKGAINFNTKKLNSLLENSIAKFEHQKYKLIRYKASDVVSEYEITFIKKLRRVLEHFIKSDGTSMEIQKCIIRLVKRSKITKLICEAIVETVKNITDEIDIQNTPPCPNMTLAHQKIICLCDYLGKHIKGFTKTLTDIINSQLFSLKNTKKNQFKTLINITLLYIGIIDLIGANKSPARLFICKCLYYYNLMAIPLIYHIIVAYPGILPHREDPEYDHSDPIITTIQCILNSLPYNMEKKDLRHPEIFHILKLFYGYERVVPSKEQVVENFIAKLRAGKFRNLSYSFAVICKQNGVEWAERYVINSNLLPLTHEYFNEIKATDKNDQNISILLEIISFIIKPFSLQFQVDKYQQIFSNFLYATDRKVVQESAVCALLRTSRFGLKNCFILLCRWNPAYNIEPTTKIMIQSFIYKKPISFWKKLLNETIVDINEDKLTQYAQVAKPLLCDYVKRRAGPLKIKILQGSIDSPDINLENCDAVIAIEIIEHLYPDVFENVPHNVFGFIKPKLAIFTTPNSDINHLFNLNHGEFRHDDHKFEWSRKQFKEWCLNLCNRYPNYVVSIHGVGRGPPEFKKYGKVTQMAVFIRKDIVNLDYKEDNEIILASNEYKLIFSQDYPFEKDERTLEEKIYDDAIYYINQYKYFEKYANYETDITTIPLKVIFALVESHTSNQEEFTNILKTKQEIGKFKIVDEEIIIDMDEFNRNCDDVTELLYGTNDSDLDINDEYEDSFESQQGKVNVTVESDESETWN